MSSQSNPTYYLCETPPTVTAIELSELLAKLISLPLIDAEAKMLSCEINWGDQITVDSRPFFEETQVSEFMSNIRSVPADFTLKRPTLAEAYTDIAEYGDRAICRAGLTGNFVDGVTEQLSVPPSLENDNTFAPFHWSLDLGPIDIGDPFGDDPRAIVGLIGVSLFGDGYFFPWTFREWIDRCGNSDLLRPLLELARDTWPASGEPAEQELIDLREEWGDDVWPYDAVDLPSGWFWGPQ